MRLTREERSLIEEADFSYGANGWPFVFEAVEKILRERMAQAWQEGHFTYQRLGPDDCKCAAYSESECGCGLYGSNVITRNPYR